MQYLYEDDYVLWIDETVEQLRKKELKNLDWEHLIEEIEGLGREQRHKVISFLRQLLLHLLLYHYWESERSYCGNGWKGEIRNFRAELDELLLSQTLYNYLREKFDSVYEKARKIALDKTGLPPSTFPLHCPYTVEQVLDSEFLPD